MALTNTQITTLINQIQPILSRCTRITEAMASGQLTNELGQQITLTDTQLANALAVLKNVVANLNTVVAAL